MRLQPNFHFLLLVQLVTTFVLYVKCEKKKKLGGIFINSGSEVTLMVRAIGKKPAGSIELDRK